MQKVIDLSRYLHSQMNVGFEPVGNDLHTVVAAIAEATVEIAALLALGKLAQTRQTTSLIEIEPFIGAAGRAQAVIIAKIRDLGGSIFRTPLAS